MRKKGLTILLTALVFLSAVALGFSSVFRIDTVALELTSVSAQTAGQAQEIQEKLKNAYDREGSFGVSREKAEEIVKGYPHLRITAFTVSYPDKLVIKLAEEGEVYSYLLADGRYAIMSKDGIVLDIRENAESRLDGGNTVEWKCKGTAVTANKGEALTGDTQISTLLALCTAIGNELGGIRRNVLRAEVVQETLGLTVYDIEMREGVRLRFYNPALLTEEKAKKAVVAYLSLSDAQRMTSYIQITEKDGVVFADYQG